MRRTARRGGFQPQSTRYHVGMADEKQAMAMLTILLATCETTLATLQAADNPVDREMVTDLERMVERTRVELAKLAARFADPS